MLDDVLWNRAGLELAAMIADGEVSSREVVDAHLERIHEVNGRLNAAVLLLEGSARSAADAADRVTSAGLTTGPFHGVPMTVKDGLDLAGHATT